MAAHLRYYEFNAKSYYISGKNLGKYSPKTIDELVEPSYALSGSKMMLIADIPHAKKAAWQQSQNNGDHRSLRIV